MSEKKYVVPNGMQRAARDGYEAWRSYARPGEQYTNGAVVAVEYALRWLAENPITPTTGEASAMILDRVKSSALTQLEATNIPRTTVKGLCAEWQRRMFLEKQG